MTEPDLAVVLDKPNYNPNDPMELSITHSSINIASINIRTVVTANDGTPTVVSDIGLPAHIYTTEMWCMESASSWLRFEGVAPNIGKELSVDVSIVDVDGNIVFKSATAHIWPTEAWIEANLGPRVVSFTKVTKDYNLTAGQVLENMDIIGRVSLIGKGAGIRNCIVRGNLVAPTSSRGIVQATNASAEDCFVQNCLIQPITPSANWNAFEGHDTLLTNNLMKDVVDGVQIKKSGVAWPAENKIRMYYNKIEDLVFWTASAPGVVHTKDTETHPDAIQAMQLAGADVSWNIFKARYARQIGHWIIRRKSDKRVYSRFEVNDVLPPAGDWEQVPLNSLPDGGPWRTIPDRGTGTEADGRYNGPRVSTVDSNNGDLSCIMIGDEEGKPTVDFTCVGNRCYGGYFAVNAGGNTKPNPLPAGMKQGLFELNLFDRSQGAATQTLNFQGGGWTVSETVIGINDRANRYFFGDDHDSRVGEIVKVRF